MSLTVRPTTYKDDTSGFAPIGHFIVEMSNLEYALDSFFFQMSKLTPKLTRSLSPRFPRESSAKIDLLMGYLINIPPLRTQPRFDDGYIGFNDLALDLEELFDQRNCVAHGANVRMHHSQGRSVYRFRKWTRLKKNEYTESEFIVSSIGFESLARRANVNSHYVERLSRFLSSGDQWETFYKTQREIIENRRFLRELGFGHLIPDTDRITIEIRKP